MASKVTLINLSKVDSTVTDELNTNFTRLADAIDTLVSRDGAAPNQLEDDIDANDNQIKNLGKPTLDNHALRLADITDDSKTAAATAVTVDDSRGFFSSDNVEGVLTEFGDASLKGVTGSDGNTVTGTAGTDGNLSQWNTDGDLVEGPDVLDEDDMSSDSDAAVPTQQSVKAWGLAAPGTSTDPGLAFDTWRTPNADRTTFVLARVAVQTDGSSSGFVDFEVDESGGTTPDYTMRVNASSSLPSGTFILNVPSTYIPAGGSYRIANTQDPNSGNELTFVREFTL